MHGFTLNVFLDGPLLRRVPQVEHLPFLRRLTQGLPNGSERGRGIVLDEGRGQEGFESHGVVWQGALGSGPALRRPSGQGPETLGNAVFVHGGGRW